MVSRVQQERKSLGKEGSEKKYQEGSTTLIGSNVTALDLLKQNLEKKRSNEESDDEEM